MKYSDVASRSCFGLFNEHGFTQRALEAQRAQMPFFHLISNDQYDGYTPHHMIWLWLDGSEPHVVGNSQKTQEEM